MRCRGSHSGANLGLFCGRFRCTISKRAYLQLAQVTTWEEVGKSVLLPSIWYNTYWLPTAPHPSKPRSETATPEIQLTSYSAASYYCFGHTTLGIGSKFPVSLLLAPLPLCPLPLHSCWPCALFPSLGSPRSVPCVSVGRTA